MTAWWATEVECASAVSRREHDGTLTSGRAAEALARLDDLRATWTIVEPSDAVRRSARRVLRTHPLRVGDALQLAAALTAAEGNPPSVGFVTLDERLGDAARREGFQVVPQQHV